MTERFSSTDARRAEIGANDVRHTYRTLTPEEQALMLGVKTLGQQLIDTVRAFQRENPHQGRECALAITRTEEAVMWAVKAITA